MKVGSNILLINPIVIKVYSRLTWLRWFLGAVDHNNDLYLCTSGVLGLLICWFLSLTF